MGGGQSGAGESVESVAASMVGVAILAYPRRWRDRYGAELEQLTLMMLAEPQPLRRRLQVLLDLMFRGLDERARRTESRGAKALLTSAATLLAGMFLLAGGLASDAVYVPNVQLSATVHLGPGVAVVHPGGSGYVRATARTAVPVIVSGGRNPQVSIGAPASVVIDPRSGLITSITRAGRSVR